MELDEYHLFERSTVLVRALYEELKVRMADFPAYIISPVEKAILFKNSYTFLSISTRKESLAISFYLDRWETDFPVTVHLQNSKNRIWHQVFIYQPEDITPQVLAWIRESYVLVDK